MVFVWVFLSFFLLTHIHWQHSSKIRPYCMMPTENEIIQVSSIIKYPSLKSQCPNVVPHLLFWNHNVLVQVTNFWRHNVLKLEEATSLHLAGLVKGTNGAGRDNWNYDSWINTDAARVDRSFILRKNSAVWLMEV